MHFQKIGQKVTDQTLNIIFHNTFLNISFLYKFTRLDLKNHG